MLAHVLYSLFINFKLKKTEKFQGKVEERLEFGTWKYGKYEEARQEIVEKTGKKNYDVEMTLWDGGMIIHASLSNDGTRFILKPLFSDESLDELFLIDDEEIKV